MIQQLNGLFFIRVALAMTFFSHALHGIVKNDVGLFGTEFLDKVGFAPLGWYIAWLVILFQIIGSVFLLLDKFTKWVSLGLGLILIAGIILVHAPEGWYVVGAGRNGMEFSVVLLLCLLAVSFPNALYIPKSNESKE